MSSFAFTVAAAEKAAVSSKMLNAVVKNQIGVPAGQSRGTVSSTLVGSERLCKYACEKTTSCDGWNYHPTLRICHLLSSVGTLQTASGWKTSTK